MTLSADLSLHIGHRFFPYLPQLLCPPTLLFHVRSVYGLPPVLLLEVLSVAAFL